MEDGRAKVKGEASRLLDQAVDQAEAYIAGDRTGGSNLNVLDAAGEFPLYRAAAGGNYSQTKSFLEQGANPSMRTAYRWTALHWAAHNGHTSVVELLLSYNADVNAVSDTGARPLGMASTEAIKAALVRKGAY